MNDRASTHLLQEAARAAGTLVPPCLRAFPNHMQSGNALHSLPVYTVQAPSDASDPREMASFTS